MNEETFDIYFKKMQKLSSRLDTHPGALQELLRFIESSKDELEKGYSDEVFFKGEYAFYNGSYEKALKYYLEAREIRHFEFFCYRASAYISKGQGFLDKALSFIQRAIEIVPADYPSLNLQENLLKQLDRKKEAEDIRQKIQSIIEFPTHSALDLPEAISLEMPNESIVKSEVKELEGIFAIAKEHEDLFYAEQIATIPKIHSSESAGIQDLLSSNGISVQQPEKDNEKDGNCEISANGIKEAVEAFHSLQLKMTENYIEQNKNKIRNLDHCLYTFHGWEESLPLAESKSEEMPLWFLSKEFPSAAGGYYIRWNHKGIAINPGKHFLRRFHHAGFNIKDIDFVIVTSGNPQAYAEVKELYNLAHQINRVDSEFHAIHYYLHENAYQILSGLLKPHLKQERHALHSLELPEGSEEIEKIELAPDIRLHYFLPKSLETIQVVSDSFGIRLELFYPEYLLLPPEKTSFIMGYISSVPLSSSIGRHLVSCDLMLTGIGQFSDKENEPTENNLVALFSLINATLPKLLLCTEFSARDGDLRLELVRKVRKESARKQEFISMGVLPVDNGLVVDLKSLQVRCSSSGKFINPHHLLVLPSEGFFSQLNYVASTCTLLGSQSELF